MFGWRVLPALCAAATLLAPAAFAQPTEVTVRLEEGPLAASLLELSQQAGVTIVFRTEDLDGRRAPALSGRMPFATALARLLADAPFEARPFGPAAFAIVAARAPAAEPALAPPAEIPGVVVLGTALARQRALARERADLTIVETLAADELGRLPDRNIGETLDRLPGVSMLVEKGEGRYVQIRGVDPSRNLLTLDGMPLGSPEAERGGRLAPLDIVSSGALSGARLVLVKTPDMDGQGIGGVLELETHDPFSQDGDRFGDLTVRVGIDDRAGVAGGPDLRAPWSLEAGLGGRAARGHVGWRLSASYADRAYVSQGIYQDDWRQRPEGVALPAVTRNNYYVIGRERVNLAAALGWRPDAQTDLTLRAFYAGWSEAQHRTSFEQTLSQEVTPTGPGTGLAGPSSARSALRYERADKTILSVLVEGERRIGALTLTAAAQTGRNELSEPFDAWEFRTGLDRGPSAWSLDSHGVVTLTPLPGAPASADPAALLFRRARFFERDMAEDRAFARLDARWAPQARWSLTAGIKLGQVERAHDVAQDQYGPAGAPFSLTAFPGLTGGVFTNTAGGGPLPNVWLDLEGLNGLQARAPSLFALDAAASAAAARQSDYEIAETIAAAYGALRFETGPFEALLGLRHERTRARVAGFVVSGANASPLRRESTHDTLLPAAILTWRPNGAFALRGAATRALAHADHDALAPLGAYRVATDGAAVLTIGAPDLPPRRAWSFDLAADYMPHRSTRLVARLFHKRIDDEITPVLRAYSGSAEAGAALKALGLEALGAPSALQVGTLAPEARAELQGLELSIETRFVSAPGPLDRLGLVMSAAFIDGESRGPRGTAPLLGQAEQSHAVTLFYEGPRIEGSLSYSYNGPYLFRDAVSTADAAFIAALDAPPEQRLRQGAFGRFDARLSARLRADLTLFAEGVNLSDEPTTEYQGGREDWSTEREYVGRTYLLGLTYAF